MGQTSAEDRGHRFSASRKPLALIWSGSSWHPLVEHDRAVSTSGRRTAAGSDLENSGRRSTSESQPRQDSQVGRAEHGLEATDQRLIGKSKRVEIHRKILVTLTRGAAWSRSSSNVR